MVKVLRVCNYITENYIELTNNGTPHLKVFKYEEVSAAKPATLKNVYNDSMQPIFARVLESICVGSQQRVCFEQLLSITKTACFNIITPPSFYTVATTEMLERSHGYGGSLTLQETNVHHKKMNKPLLKKFRENNYFRRFKTITLLAK